MHKQVNKDWGKIKQDAHAADVSNAEISATEDATIDSSGATETEINDPATLAHPSYREMEEKLTAAEQLAHENWEKSVRAMADVDNIRRRAERDVQNAQRYSVEKFATALLPVIDSLEQALKLADEHQDLGMHEGIGLTLKLFEDAFQKFNVVDIQPEGEVFNPMLHEAMAMQEAADVPANTVLTVFQKGYTLYDRVIRPARVIVAK